METIGTSRIWDDYFLDGLQLYCGNRELASLYANRKYDELEEMVQYLKRENERRCTETEN